MILGDKPLLFQGVLSQWVSSYGPKNMDTTQFSLVANDWGITYPVLDMAPPLLAEEEGPPT
jgi:hypothetical protein